jgi:6-pyruvoyltetrahydropterin/6-carboxytetrahydropterin synthase
MYELRVASRFAAAHQLREFRGACENLHGHNWKVEVYLTGENLGGEGILMDFGEMKKATKEALGTLDHHFLNELEAFKDTNPSSENIARHIFKYLSGKLNRDGIRVSKVTAWESDDASASYMEAQSGAPGTPPPTETP